MITWHQITGPMIYEQNRLDEISALEGVLSLPYLDTKRNPSIGIGFNLRIDNVRAAVLEAMGIDAQASGLSSAAQAVEQGYIDQIVVAVGTSFPRGGDTVLQLMLNGIMFNRSHDPALQAYGYITSRTTFEMQT